MTKLDKLLLWWEIWGLLFCFGMGGIRWESIQIWCCSQQDIICCLIPLISSSLEKASSLLTAGCKKSSQMIILNSIGQCLKMWLWSQRWILQDKTFLGDFLRDAILGDFAYLDEVPMKVTFWKPRCPILQASMDWQGYSQRKLVNNNFSTLSSHAESPSEGYIPVSMPSAILSGFSLPIYVSVSLNLLAFCKEENVMITGCVGVIQAFGVCNHIGLSSSPPLISEGMNSPSVESPCLTAAICLAPQPTCTLNNGSAFQKSCRRAFLPASLLWVTLSTQCCLWTQVSVVLPVRQLFEAKLFVLLIWAT